MRFWSPYVVPVCLGVVWLLVISNNGCPAHGDRYWVDGHRLCVTKNGIPCCVEGPEALAFPLNVMPMVIYEPLIQAVAFISNIFLRMSAIVCQWIK